MIDKIAFGAAILLLFISTSFAQTAAEDYRKNEAFVGFSHQRGERTFAAGDLNGFEVSVVRNFNRYFGIKGDFSAAYRHRDFRSPLISGTATAGTVDFKQKNSRYNLLGGIQFKDNASDARLKPFGHILIGIGHLRSRNENVRVSGTAAALLTGYEGGIADTGLAGAVGGGLDIKINDKIDFRAVQIDYNPSRFNIFGSRNNVRFGIGIVFR